MNIKLAEQFGKMMGERSAAVTKAAGVPYSNYSMRKGLTKKANDLTALAPKWSERGHLLAALPKHLAETQEAIKTQQNIDKEMTDLALIASAWMKSQQQKELLESRLKRFKETAGYPSMASK